jgi:large subunit ribosomal protein L7/L12
MTESNKETFTLTKKSKKSQKPDTTHLLEKLKQQKAILEARIQAAEARMKQGQRKKDTRRKILIGSYYLDKAMAENTLPQLKVLMDKYLSRESDRKLFDLPLKPQEP